MVSICDAGGEAHEGASREGVHAVIVLQSKLTLEHVNAYNGEVAKAGITDGRVAPAIIPDYTEEQVRERQLTANYVGNVR